MVDQLLYGDVASSKVYGKKTLCFTTLDSRKPGMSFMALNDIHGRINDLNALSGKLKFGETDLVIFNGDMLD
jgi:hypothetical protein